MAERWHARLSTVFGRGLSGRQPLILYANHPHFEQTNALQGELGEGTGGVTEVFKRRMVLPFGGSLAETDHVIGHELVHAFQFSLTGQGRSVQTGGIPGALLPFALRRLPVVNAILDPYFIAGYGVPKLALAPLFVLWFGIDLEPKVALVASIVSFLVFFSTMAGVQAVNAQFVNMARVAGATEAHIARHIVWPGAIPYSFAGFRIAAPYSIGAAVVGELISSNRGLGYMIQAGATDFDTTTVFVSLGTLTMIVVLVNICVAHAERWLLRWRPRSGAGAAWVPGA